ncbi:MAG: cobyrinate a,c-diamide synthase [Magnetococcales bacterium]|nr:cobyrinate a,c-diamide synthase [Magnetococcales bacterium]
MKEKITPRIMISATRKSSGKTLLTLGLAALLTRRGVKVQTFKKGPDFIDPKWLTAATGRPCVNLDFYIMGGDKIHGLFQEGAFGADLCLVEGNHGLFDGQDPEGGDCSAALARWLETPVVLVVDCRNLARSIAPLVCGHLHFPGGEVIVGLILNNVATPRQEGRLRAILERYCPSPILGVLPRSEAMVIHERHLGLTPTEEGSGLERTIDQVTAHVERHLDPEVILKLARQVAPPTWRAPSPLSATTAAGLARPRVRVGFAADRAFHFYYPENLQALRQQGVDLVPFNLLEDSTLPPVDGLFIGGGFPEMFMEPLTANRPMMQSLQQASLRGMPIYAECGGLMVLAESLRWGSLGLPMAGVLPIDVTMEKRPQGYGYMEIEGTGHAPWPPPGEIVRCHEFHYSHITRIGHGVRYAYRVRRGTGIDGQHDGMLYRNVLASYAHIHVVGAPAWAEHLARFWRHGALGG